MWQRKKAFVLYEKEPLCVGDIIPGAISTADADADGDEGRSEADYCNTKANQLFFFQTGIFCVNFWIFENIETITTYRRISGNFPCLGTDENHPEKLSNIFSSNGFQYLSIFVKYLRSVAANSACFARPDFLPPAKTGWVGLRYFHDNHHHLDHADDSGEDDEVFNQMVLQMMRMKKHRLWKKLFRSILISSGRIFCR